MNYEQLRAQLIATKQDIEERLDGRESANLSESMRDEFSELSTADNHPADDASELYLRELGVGDRVRDEANLNDIDQALAAMDSGTYGECARCKQAIPMARLAAMPTAKYCMACQRFEERHESHFHRPVEEAVLYPGYGQYWLDKADQTGFDAEDAYQAVARHNERKHEDTLYEEIPLDDNLGIVDEIDSVSQSTYEHQLPPSATDVPRQS